MASTEGYVTSPGSRSSEGPSTRTGDGPGDRRSSDEIRRSIERQRDDLDVTAEALHRKLAPRELAEHLWNDMRTRVSSGAGDVVGVMKRHPVPLGLIGAGIAWWIYETSSGRGFAFGNGGHRYEDENLGVGSMSTGSYRSQSGTRDYSSSYSSRYSSGEGYESEGYSESGGWRQRTMDAAHRSGEKLRTGAHHAREGFSDAIDKNPLALGAACFSLGLLAAIAVPASRWENQTMGETRDRVTRQARRTARRAAVDAAEQGARAAQDAAERIKEEANRSPSEYEDRRAEHGRTGESFRGDQGSGGGAGSTSGSRGGAYSSGSTSSDSGGRSGQTGTGRTGGSTGSSASSGTGGSGTSSGTQGGRSTSPAGSSTGSSTNRGAGSSGTSSSGRSGIGTETGRGKSSRSGDQDDPWDPNRQGRG